MCIQFLLTALSANDVMVATFLNRTTAGCPFKFCLLNAFLLCVDKDDMINRASPCIPLSNLPNIMECTKTGTYYSL